MVFPVVVVAMPLQVVAAAWHRWWWCYERQWHYVGSSSVNSVGGGGCSDVGSVDGGGSACGCG